MEGSFVIATLAQHWRVRLLDGQAPVRPLPLFTLRPSTRVLARIEARHAAAVC
jgi:hypothetical protein